MKNYQNLLRDVMRNGLIRTDRTGTGVRGVFGRLLEFDLTEGFPAVTTKKLYFKSVAAELAGFLEGTESAIRMRELGTNIWDANANAESWQLHDYCQGPDDMGRIYGSLWRNFYGCDQLRSLVTTLISNPTDRRMVVTAWDPSERRQCLPPCHIFWQVYVRNDEFLDLLFYMRSVDLFLGLPFDIASYALLMHIIAQQVDLVPGNLVAQMGDAHIYTNHFDQVETILARNPLSLPELDLWDGATIDNFLPEHANLVGYNHLGEVKAPMAV